MLAKRELVLLLPPPTIPGAHHSWKSTYSTIIVMHVLVTIALAAMVEPLGRFVGKIEIHYFNMNSDVAPMD